MLELKKVTKRFGETVAVNNVSLNFAPGQMVGIIGRSGAGKSTLLRLINRLTRISEGTITFGDIEIGSLEGRELRAWRARCAMIFQQFNLVNRLDVLTNVLIGRIGTAATLPVMFKRFPAADRASAAMALDRLDLLPQGLQRADTLSGGQQQRVAIARAHARLVMDALRASTRRGPIATASSVWRAARWFSTARLPSSPAP